VHAAADAKLRQFEVDRRLGRRADRHRRLSSTLRRRRLGWRDLQAFRFGGINFVCAIHPMNIVWGNERLL
jgi:hypothetical protein